MHPARPRTPQMKLAELKRTLDPASERAPVRGTEAQDTQVENTDALRRRRLWIYVSIAGAIVFVGIFTWLARSWANSEHMVSGERVRTASVSTGHFVRDVAGQGTVVASVNPTLFAIAP